jgi:hypothetical protein
LQSKNVLTSELTKSSSQPAYIPREHRKTACSPYGVLTERLPLNAFHSCRSRAARLCAMPPTLRHWLRCAALPAAEGGALYPLS